MKKTIMVIFVFLVISCQAWAQKLAVTSPNGGETLVLGNTWPITWAAANVAVKVKLQLIKPGGAIFGVIATNLVSTSSPYPWTVGQTASGSAPAGSYKVRVIALDGSEQDTCDALFTISEAATPPDNPPGAQQVQFHGKLEPAAALHFKFPRLEVSGIDLAPNAEGFGIIFSYKNVGEAPLPKASEVPLKPSYRVLIDGKETASGSLFIPAFAAQPGWEQEGYFGGWIVLPTLVNAEYSNWHIGSSITVHINENKVMGMESHTLTMPLKPIALKYKCDALINGVSLDWQTHVVTVSLRYLGQLQPLRQVSITCSDEDDVFVNPKDDFTFFQVVKLTEGQTSYSLSKKINFPASKQSIILFVKSYVAVSGSEQVTKVVDMDYRNNFWKQLKFVYPDPNPVM
jgi:hypothetical protein